MPSPSAVQQEIISTLQAQPTALVAALQAIPGLGGGGGGITDGDKGDIVVSGVGAVWAIDPAVATAAGRAVMSAADAAAQRTALGLGTAAVAASSSFATSAQGTLAGTAIQPGAQLTQAAVTAATAAGVTLLNAADAAAQKAALAITQANVTANAPVAITNSATLTAASHADRQLVYSGTTATLAISNDATGGWANDTEVLIQNAAGSAGVPTISTPDGKTVTGSATQPIGARRKGTNSWDVYLLPQSTAGGSGTVITVIKDLTSTTIPTGVTTESATLKTLTLGTLAAGQRVKISGVVTGSSSNDTTVVRVKLGGTTILTFTTGTFAAMNAFIAEINCLASASQASYGFLTASSIGPALNSTVTGTTVDTTASVDLTVTGQFSTTTRTGAITHLIAEVYPAS